VPLATQTLRRVLALGVVALFATACSDSTGTNAAPSAPNANLAVSAAAGSPPGLAVAAANKNKGKGSRQLLACNGPKSNAQSKAVIGPEGGFVAAGGSIMAVPPGAVPVATTFTMSVKGMPAVRVDIRAGNADHYVFQRPVVVTIDYSSCGSAADNLPALSAWYVDNSGNTLLEDMGGMDDRGGRRVFFATDHLSGYAVAY